MEVIKDGIKAGILKVIPYNGKIADITHADLNKHTLDLETALLEVRKIISLVLYAYRVSGSGDLKLYPNEGTEQIETSNATRACKIIIKDGSQQLQYALAVINDDFDLYCMGYTVEAW